jgi:hypothetical protein
MPQGASWICPNCGNTNRPGARFCSRCRTPNPARAGTATHRIPGAPTAPARAPGGRPAPPPAMPRGPIPAAEPGDVTAAGRELISRVGNV